MRSPTTDRPVDAASLRATAGRQPKRCHVGSSARTAVDTALNAALCAPPQDGVREITLDGDDVKVSAPAAAAGAAMDTTA